MNNKDFTRMSAYTSVAAGIFALLYAYCFLIDKNVMLSSLFLLLLGLSALEVMVALFGRLRDVNEDFARLVMILGVIGAVGMSIHGGYDLANAINKPSVLNADLPNQVDPRGLLAFGFTGLAIIKASWLMGKSKKFPEGLPFLGALSGVLFLIIYLARLTVLDPANPVLLYPVLLNGFVLSPVWYFWLAKEFSKKN